MTFLHSGHNPQMNLSAKELLEISQEISRDFTPCFSSRMPELAEDIRLTPRELLDIGEEIGRDFASQASYNIPQLMLLPVDPEHLYAYWSLEQSWGISMPDNDDNEQLTLRIYAQPVQERAVAKTAHWFDVAIDRFKTRQQVTLPNPVEQTAYFAAIGKCCADDSFVAVAYSDVIHAHYGQSAWHQDPENSSYCLGKNTSGLGISKAA